MPSRYFYKGLSGAAKIIHKIVRDLKTHLRNQQNVFKEPMSKQRSKSCAMITSIKVNYLLEKECKTFFDKEFIKEMSDFF